MLLSDNSTHPMYAGNRWCPKATTALGGVQGVNRAVSGEPAKGTSCLGSKCALWQFATSAPTEHRGYCGLGPKPTELDDTISDTLPEPGTAGPQVAIPINLRPRNKN